MGGEAIQLMRVWRVKATLDECVNSKVFADLGSAFAPLKSMLKLDEYWDYHYAICQLLFPLYSLLRLADTRIGVYDQIKYTIRQIDRLLDDSLANVCEKWGKAPVVRLAGMKQIKFKGITAGKKTIGSAKTEGEDSDGEFVSWCFYVHDATQHYCISF